MPDRTSQQEQVRETARQWLSSGEVRFVIGYSAGQGNVARPTFIRDADDVERLVWDSTCVGNLSLYLEEEILRRPAKGEEPDESPIGIVVKPCDSKAVVELVKEHIVPRDRVRIIGLTCEGVCDPGKVGAGGSGPPEITPETIADKCTVCTLHNPAMADVVIGEAVQDTVEDTFADVAELEALPPEERWAFWERHLSRCVRCYGCRDVCPLCYCEECVFDREKPYRWNEKSVRLPENIFYHMVRAMHLAGRCVDCGECERVCPMNIPIRRLNRFLERQARGRYDVRPGLDPGDDPMFGTCDVNDPEDFIW